MTNQIWFKNFTKQTKTFRSKRFIQGAGLKHALLEDKINLNFNNNEENYYVFKNFIFGMQMWLLSWSFDQDIKVRNLTDNNKNSCKL